ncbi:MAG: hypothetical protein HQM12_07845 [SAR324 cluster bacterium]|nr:hypothetical protein [SAR324 cluster bacterium]
MKWLYLVALIVCSFLGGLLMSVLHTRRKLKKVAMKKFEDAFMQQFQEKFAHEMAERLREKIQNGELLPEQKLPAPPAKPEAEKPAE